MFTAAGLIGLFSSVIMRTALYVRGHSVMTAGLKGGDGRLHFVELNLEINSQIGHEIGKSTNQAYHSWVTVHFCAQFLLLVNKFPTEFAINLR